MNTILATHHLKKVYGEKTAAPSTAIQDISLDMHAGEFLGIMGPSGSGKSTLLNLIATLDRQTAGEIQIDGQNLSQLKDRELTRFRGEKLGFIFQDYNLLESLGIFDNIALPLMLQRVKKSTIRTRIETVAHSLGIQDLLTKYPTEISGGQQQRVAAARALVHQPTLLLADEPTGALDSKNAKILLETFERLNREEQTSILMVTHDAFSASYAHRILFIRDGLVYKELKRTESKEDFYREILQTLALLGEDMQQQEANQHVLS